MSNAGKAKESEAQMTSIGCEHDDELVALGAMRLLSPAEEAQLAERLQHCPACQQRLEEYRALAKALPRLLTSLDAASSTLAAQTPAAGSSKPAFSLQQASKTAENAQAAEQDTQEQPQPYLLPGPRVRRQQRLLNTMSGLAAVLLLAGLLTGFRWLVLEREQGQTVQPSGCVSRTHTSQASTWQCGILVLDYTRTPATLIPLDARTGKPLPGLEPLPVGNAILSAITPDHRTLVLAISPTQSDSGVYLQVVSLDQWKIGPQIKTGHYVDALALSDDGLHIYAIMPVYSNGTTTIWLQSYLCDPNHARLQAGWKSPLPFLPNSNGVAVSPDGATLYAFSEKTSPAQVMQAHLGENDLEQIQVLKLPQLASGADPAANAAPYKKGDPIPEVYHPAVIFSPDRTILYLVYAPQNDPAHDRLLTVYLLKWSGISDLPITDATQTLADLSPDSASSSSSLAYGAPATQMASTATPLNERTERGVISPDGQWLYVTGESQTTTTFADGTLQEKTDYLGLWQINIQNGKMLNRWYQGDTFYEVHISMDGQALYLFRQPPNGAYLIHKSTSLLTFSTQAQQVVSSLDGLKLPESIIAVP
jgi:hypothetical protein